MQVLDTTAACFGDVGKYIFHSCCLPKRKVMNISFCLRKKWLKSNSLYLTSGIFQTENGNMVLWSFLIFLNLWRPL